MGGIGKSTLVQNIYNNNSLKEHFGHTIFLTVSQSFELKEIIKNMLRKLHENEDSMRGDTYELLRMLHSKLDKKYLIILDDVWTVDEGLWWESLKSGFPHISGSCVIVTTRCEEVARSMGATDRCMHHLQLLSDENAWLLFSKVVFQNEGGQCPNTDLEAVGKEIVCQCKGLPLAIKIVGGMMLGKDKCVHAWSRVSKNLKEELTAHKRDKVVFSTLRLSYEELPAHLKPCLLSFAVFPEDFEILPAKMIHWWIGEGFVWEKDGKTAYEIGQECIYELFCRCLLVGVHKGASENRIAICRLHDMVRDMVIKIAREEHFMGLDDADHPSFSVPSRRGGILRNMDLGSFNANAKLLRTLIGLNIEAYESIKILGQNMQSLTRLRVLDLSFSTIVDSDVADSDWLSEIGLLRHLVCLRIDNCRMQKLPVSIANLRKLQILHLYNWPNLRRLPSQITKLQQLNILQVIGCDSLECMPKGLSNLFNLKMLRGYRLVSSRDKDGSRVVELKNLNQFKHLFIEIKSEDQIIEGELNVLSKLRYLKMNFEGSNGSHELVRRVNGWLSILQQLEDLHLYGLPGDTTPTWLNPASLPNLHHLSIFFSGRLVQIHPIFWEFKDGVWQVEVLVLGYLDELEEEWPKIKAAMPCLRLLKVEGCPKLKLFPFNVTKGGTWSKVE